ncbi:uncharacterized protein CANTADRAFT_51491 [Suhomyces tanzawaensis NRRL Y-17324]|uniref:Fork-head domain-containing protein n=1 Tax=Suhomyces tanzawaensis NRRL Y-17324 TaxID=984487 RepID=A0A1E4SJ28_9ASCO|nr:uncharacterized protein CANTADRAFT_51491 [Suhomyces tanzawaensis NRRL Y-17324]ODV79509.1 hypothetical protein CANTADRAFT_51491 [Suhomyces tanzawaensis NRRL Y-17324]
MARFDPGIASVNHSSGASTIDEPSSRLALLSPAFSSPNHRLHRPCPVSSPPMTINPSSSLSLPSEDKPPVVAPAKPGAGKKAKKAKKDAKETVFDLDSEDKPPYSYATLIGISILSHEDKRLPLSQIYQWISDTFKYYKREDVGWQNSIRHNLSLNKAFVKGEKSKDGKGHFWCIKPGYEEQFLKSRSVKKSSYHEVMDQINLVRSRHREEAKRSMNAIPSSPNTESKPFSSTNYNYTTHNTVNKVTRPKRKRIPSSTHNDDNEYDYTYDQTKHDDDDDEVDDDYSDDNKDEDMTHILDPPLKKQRMNEKLGEPFGQWDNGNSLVRSNPPHFIITDSPNKPLLAGKNLTYTSSFSCNSNLELSPIRPSETGPLLEPITPANNVYQNHQLQHVHTSISASLNSSTSSIHHSLQQRPLMTHSSTPNVLQRTPKSNILKTPLRNLRTPQTNSIMKKLWNSPSYLDEFYYSPLVNSHTLLHSHASVHGLLNSYDDDDMIMRSFENHPHNHQTPVLSRKSGSTTSIASTVVDSSRNLFNDFKKIDVLSSVSSKSDVSDIEESASKGAHNISTSSTDADD